MYNLQMVHDKMLLSFQSLACCLLLITAFTITFDFISIGTSKKATNIACYISWAIIAVLFFGSLYFIITATP